MLKTFRPQLTVEHVHDIDIAGLRARGVRGVLIDLDNTLTHWRCAHVRPEVLGWVGELLAAGLRACVLTNAARPHRVTPIAARLGLPAVVNARKPFPGGFRRAMRLLGTDPAGTAMVGDQLFTDIFGGNRLGLYTVLVEPQSTDHELWLARYLQRPIERFIGRGTGSAGVPPSHCVLRWTGPPA